MGGLQSVQQVTVIEANLQFPAVALDGALIVSIADGGGGAQGEDPVTEGTAERALLLLGDDQGAALDGGDQLPPVHGHRDGIVGGDGLAVVEELTLQAAGDQSGLINAEHDVPGTLDDLNGLVGVPADFAHLV